MERWIARCVKTEIWCYWRKMRVRPVVHEGWENAADRDDEVTELLVSNADWMLLWEHFVDKWPLDVIARRHDTTVYGIRKQLGAAEARLRRAVNERQ
jgi:hypothetical protein